LLSPDFPFAPKRFPFFYGWVVVAASTLGVIASIPGQTMGVGVFNDDLLAATGLSRLELSIAYMVGTISSGLTLPFGGRLLDRFGARLTAMLAALGLGGTLVYLSFVDRLAPRGSAVAIAAIVLGFFMVRFTGQGMLTMVSRTMLGKWFDRRRGLAAGISSLFVGPSFAVAATLFAWWISASTWRGAWREMALVVGVGMTFLAWLLYRDNPEECGLRMDGMAPDHDDSGAPKQRQVTRDEAIRTLAFWGVTFALAAQALVITGVTFHIVDLGARHGLSRVDAVFVFIPNAIGSVAVSFLGGVVADRVPVRWLLVAMMGGQALALFAFTDFDDYFWLAVVGLAISGGLFPPISTVAFPRFFGRTHLGAIAGVEMMVLVVASALGPTLLAASVEQLGSYTPALLGCLAFPAVGALLALGTRPPAQSA